MRIVVTGAAGFVGRALLQRLADHDVVAVDSDLRGFAGVQGDLCDLATLNRAFTDGCDAVIHLATVPGGAAEEDPARAKRVNLDATMALIDAAAGSASAPRFIFASSIAVLGDPLPDPVDDDTLLAPRMIYGAHKAMMEQWIETQTRRGAIRGLSLRFPGIVARPEAAAGMKSAFMSNLFHDLAARREVELPVSPDSTMWLMSVERAAANLAEALQMEDTGTVTLPSLRVSMAELVSVVAQAVGADPNLVRYSPDPALEATFGRQPKLSTMRAEAMGFSNDGSLDQLVAAAIKTLA